MKAAGLKHPRTLIRWHQCGLIPPPEIVPHPSGRGRTSRYPAWVIDHARTIRQLIEGGQDIKEIIESFGTDWAIVADRYPGPVKLSLNEVASQRIDSARNVDEAVRLVINVKLIAAFAAAHKQLKALTLPTVTLELQERAVQLYRDGCNPVLLVAPPRPHVVADFQVSTLLSEAVVETAYLVVPLTEGIAEALGKKSKKRKRTVRPAQKVLVKDTSTQEREVPFTPLINLSFELDNE